MASCSKESKNVGKDVFLSHSGKQKDFVRQLYKDLTTKGVPCFFDESPESLPLGEKWAPLIFEAAKTCRVAVLLLSMDFVQSKWPMLELSAIVAASENSNLKIFPLFFKISPADLTEGTSNIQAEWARLEIPEETQTKWKEALRKVRKYNGLRFKEGENEVSFRDQIVKKIRTLLPPSPIVSMPVGTVGLEERCKEVIGLLQLTSVDKPRMVVDKPRMVVVIYGFGGIGKTTLAEAVVAKIDLTPYHYARLNFDIDSSRNDVKSLQKQMLNGLFPDRDTKFTCCQEGQTVLTKEFQKEGNKPVFLFIDNALRRQELRDLLPKDMKGLPNGSRILVTTRDLSNTDMFMEHEAGLERQQYVVQALSDQEASNYLLEGCADRQLTNIQDDVERILNVCKGVPLVLRIVRGHFKKQGYRADKCSQILKALETGKQIKEEDLTKTLCDFVYEQLEESSQQAFLDICCLFFDRMDPSHVKYIVGAQELTSLEEATFVQRSDDSKTLVVHDIIRERGRNKAESTRIMDVKSLNDAANEQRLKDIRGLWLNDDCGCVVKKQHLKAMTELRVLALGKHTRVSHRCEVTFKELRYLTVDGDISSLPVNLERLPNLAIYEGPLFKEGFSMHKLPEQLTVIIAARQSYYKSTYSKESTSIGAVKELDLSKLENLQKVPHWLPLLASLQILRWENGDKMLTREKCHKWFWRKKGSIEELPKEVCQLTKLTQLTLSAWRSLTCLPESFGELKGLTHLDLSKCNALERLPESFEQLAALEKLSLSRCKALKCLPESFGELKALNELNLTLCRALKRLPESFGELKSLKSLDLISCDTLESLPESFGQLAAIKTLTLMQCTALQCLSESFGKLKALEGLDLEFCKNLKRLPESFRKLTSLLYIRMAYCPARADLSKFEANLKHLTIVDEDTARADNARFKQFFIEDRLFKNHQNMREVVLYLKICCKRCKRHAIKIIVGVEGVEYLQINTSKKRAIVIGDVDPAFLANELKRKYHLAAVVVYAGPA